LNSDIKLNHVNIQYEYTHCFYIRNGKENMISFTTMHPSYSSRFSQQD